MATYRETGPSWNVPSATSRDVLTPAAWALLACDNAATADAVRYGQREVAPFVERQLRTGGLYDLAVHRETQAAA